MSPTLSPKFVSKYMAVAKAFVAGDHPCPSRKVGAVIVAVGSHGASRIVSMGYNGPARGLPHPDSAEHLRNVLWPQLDVQDQVYMLGQFDVPQYHPLDDARLDALAAKYEGCKQCPRRILSVTPGERLGLCGCQHAERNAISQATESLDGTIILCHCPLPCWDCAGAIINSGIKTVYCLQTGESYSRQSRWMFEKAGVAIVECDPDTYVPIQGDQPSVNATHQPAACPDSQHVCRAANAARASS
jgi:deoxycytidylate deaminase